MTQFIFVLTGAHPLKTRRYSASLQLATMAVRHFHPEATITCLCDGETWHQAKSASWGSWVDQFIACPEVSGGPVHRSRVIKTTMRRRVKGPFVYLDTDTLLIDDIKPLVDCDSELGLVADSWFPDAVGDFPSWCGPVYGALGWEQPTTRYYNGGVLFAGDTRAIHQLFDEWHLRYRSTVAFGVNQDQPSFNSAIQHLSPTLKEFPEDYNFFCGRSPREIPVSTRLLHVCSSLQTTQIPAYEEALHRLQHGEPVLIADLLHQLKNERRQVRRKWAYLGEMHRRAHEFVQGALHKTKLRSAQRQ